MPWKLVASILSNMLPHPRDRLRVVTLVLRRSENAYKLSKSGLGPEWTCRSEKMLRGHQIG